MTVNYFNRDFDRIRQDLISFAKQYHPDKFTYFNDASPDMMYLEMVAYVGDLLNFYIDKSFNESFRTTAQAREALVRIASDLGFYEFGSRPSTTQVVLSINVPFVADGNGGVKPDPELLLSIQPNMSLLSDNGQQFEILQEVNFADERNRTIIPNLDSNNQLIDYTIRKQVPAKAGITQIQRFYVSADAAKPFLTITLDEVDVTEVTGVVSVPGDVYTAPSNSSFEDPDLKFWQVKWLAQKELFVETDPNEIQDALLQQQQIQGAVKQGQNVTISRRFILRRDINNLVSLTFGNSVPDFDSFDTAIQTAITPNSLSLNQVLNNTSLGEIPPPDSTLFIRYRTGGGSTTNTEIGQINTITSKTFFPPSGSPDSGQLQTVRRSLQVSNEVPAVGGREELTDNEIRHQSAAVFSAQERGVTAGDLKALISEMPAQFGSPFRLSIERIHPRVANFTAVKTGLDLLMDQLLQETTQVNRILKRQEINEFLNQLQQGEAFVPTNQSVNGGNPIAISTLTANLLGASPTLWLGEKERLHLVGINENGYLSTLYQNDDGIWISPNEILKQNIREYLIGKRVIGDWIDIVDGIVNNIQIEFTILADASRKQQVLTDCLNALADYFAIDKWDFNQHIFVSNVETILQEINGVINVVNLQFFNIFGTDTVSGRQYQPEQVGRYRLNEATAVNATNNKFVMRRVNNTILSYPDMIFECKYPDVDIIGKAL